MSGRIAWREEAISRRHDRRNFDCGSQELNEYLRRYARQNHESGGARTFLAVSPDDPVRILGYYTISPGAFNGSAFERLACVVIILQSPAAQTAARFAARLDYRPPLSYGRSSKSA